MEDNEAPQEQIHNQTEEDEWLMSCRCDSAKAISTLLSCLHYRDGSSRVGGFAQNSSTQQNASRNSQSTARRQRTRISSPQLVTVFCNQNCITFHVYGTSKQFQASVDIQSTWFADYRVAQAIPLSAGQEEDQEQDKSQAVGSEFCVNLTTVLECLNVLGTAQSLDRTQVCLSYNVTQEYLKMELLLEECGILATSSIPGMIPPDANDDEDTTGHGLHLAFRSSPVLARMILQSEILRQIIPEIESVGGATVGTVAIGKRSGLEIATVGHLGECLVAIPAKGSHVVMLDIEHNDGDSQMSKITSSFPLHSLMASFRGLEMAQETCLTINANGMMAIQHQVLLNAFGMPETSEKETSTTPCFVEFILCCLQEDYDENNEIDYHQGRADRKREKYTRGMASPSSQPEDDTNSYQTSVSRDALPVASQTALPGKNERSLPLAQHEEDENNGGGFDDNDYGDDSMPLPTASTNPLFNRLVDSPFSKENGFRRRQRRRLGKKGEEAKGQKRGRRNRHHQSNEKEHGNDSQKQEPGKKEGDDGRDVSSESKLSAEDQEVQSSESEAGSRNLLESEDEEAGDCEEGAEGQEGYESGQGPSTSKSESEESGNNNGCDELTQPLDVTAPAAARSLRHRRAGDNDDGEGCSSPEIVYGPQN